jgi:hypothetical protein
VCWLLGLQSSSPWRSLSSSAVCAGLTCPILYTIFIARAHTGLRLVMYSAGACAAAQAGNVQKLAAILKRTPGAVHSDGATGHTCQYSQHLLDLYSTDGTTSIFIIVAGSSGYTPLHYAARAGHLEAVKLLLNSGRLTCTKAVPITSAAHPVRA